MGVTSLAHVYSTLCLVCFLTAVCAVPWCSRTQYTTECSVSEQSDFAALPTNVTQLHVFFDENHRVTLGPGVFPVRPSLVDLTIDLNHIREDIQPGAFILLTSLTSLTFTDSDPYRPLRSKRLRAGIFSGMGLISKLEMEETGISQVDQGVFHNLPMLETLNLRHNMIASLPAFTFTNTTKLKRLNLGRNKLTAITGGTFLGLVSLEQLDLSENQIENLTAPSFGALPKLDKLLLNQNILASIGPGTLQNLRSLSTLLLQNNKLEGLKQYMFSALTKLQSLDISKNKLTYIEDRSFNDLINLEFLEIFDNNLRMFTPDTFKGLNKLIYLDAYINNLTELHANVFSEMPELGSLHLHQANIVTISADAFNNLNKLSILTLQQNNMTAFPEGILDNFDQLAFLDISLNPWNCTCDLTWLHHWSDGHYLGAEMNTTCAATGEAVLQYARDNYYICRRAKPTTTTTTTTTTTPTPPTTTRPPTTEPSTTGSLVIQTSSFDPGYKSTANATGAEARLGGILTPMLKIIIGVVVGVGVLLILLIIILACYLKSKKKAFWRPPRILEATSPTSPDKGDKNFLKFYSQSKDQSSYIDAESGGLENGVAVRTNSDRNGHAPGNKSYVNHGLHMDDVANANHKAMQRRAEEQPAVVAYGQHDPVSDVLHSYSHSVSDTGTHHIDNNLPLSADEVHLNDLNQRSNNDSKRDKKKKEKKSKSKKRKTSNESFSDNENPYKDVYGAPTMAMSDLADHSPREGNNEQIDDDLRDPYADDNPPYNPGYRHNDQPDEFPMY